MAASQTDQSTQDRCSEQGDQHRIAGRAETVVDQRCRQVEASEAQGRVHGVQTRHEPKVRRAPEERPVPHVHDRTVREARDDADDGEGDDVAALRRPSAPAGAGKAGGCTHPPGGDHLVRQPGPHPRRHEGRDQKRRRTAEEAELSAHRVAGAEDEHEHRRETADAAHQSQPQRRVDGCDGGDQRETSSVQAAAHRLNREKDDDTADAHRGSCRRPRLAGTNEGPDEERGSDGRDRREPHGANAAAVRASRSRAATASTVTGPGEVKRRPSCVAWSLPYPLSAAAGVPLS